MTLARFRPTLIARVLAALAAVGLLPLAIASFGLLGLNRKALDDQVRQTHVVAARTVADGIERYLATYLALAQGTAANALLTDPRSPAAQELLRESLTAWADLDVEALVVKNDAGQEVLRAQVRGEDAAGRIERALAGPATGAVDATLWQGVPLVRVTAPLKTAAGDLVLVVDGSRLAETALPDELGEQAGIVVADRDWRAIVGPQQEVDALPAALKEQAAKLDGTGRFPGRQAEVLAAYSQVPSAGWRVVSQQPLVVAEEVAGRMRRRELLAVGAALALIGGLSFVAWRSVVRPLRELVAAQRSLVKGRGGQPGLGDEIRDLRAAFDQLRRSLAERDELDHVFLGRYQVIELLGSGGMGTVFRGWDPRLERPVALKTIRLAEDVAAERRPAMLSSLVKEALTVARLNHPNVVAVYDLEESGDAAFVAMELVDGVSLERLLLKHGRLTPEHSILLAAGVARGLAAAHVQGIVHRDVKPANVLLGNDGAIKVADFGIADLVSRNRVLGDSVFGTPGYLAPEVLLGAPYGAAADLFALGVLLYECLTGALPFDGWESATIVRSTLFLPIRAPKTRVVGIPAQLDSLVLHLLERDPVQRPADAAAVAAELERMAARFGVRWDLAKAGAAGGEPHAAARPAQWIGTVRLKPQGGSQGTKGT